MQLAIKKQLNLFCKDSSVVFVLLNYYKTAAEVPRLLNHLLR